MADADWVKYRQIRGKALPTAFAFAGAGYTLEKTFKRDFYAATGLYRKARAFAGGPDRVVLKIYHTDALGKVLPLGWLGRWLWRREMKFGKLLHDVPGIAHVLGSWGRTGIVREYVPGENLREFLRHSRPDAAFFPALRRTLEEIHRRGVSHNDLSKPENILVRADGSPILIDFQIALHLPGTWPVLGAVGRRILAYMQGCDHYHLSKQHACRRPEDYTPEEKRLALNKGVLLRLHGALLRRPYRAVRHLVLRRFLTLKKSA